MDWGKGDRRHQPARALVALLVSVAFVLGAATAGAEIIEVNGISIPTVTKAARKQPVIVGYGANPDVPSADVLALRALVHQLDPGRIWVIVTPPVSESAIGKIANAVASNLNKDGVVLGVAGYNFYVSTTWGNRSGQILAAAVDHPGDTMSQLLHDAIVAFAAADRKAGHPTPLADQIRSAKQAAKAAQQGIGGGSGSGSGSGKPAKQGIGGGAGASTNGTSNTTTSGITTSTNGSGPSATTGGAGGGVTAPKHSSSSSSGLIEAIVAGVLILLVLGGLGVRRARASAQQAHVRKIEDAEAHTKVKSDFTRLGERLGDLDIDQQLKNADPQGKAEYAKALDNYQEAERRLKNEKDSYQFQKATDAVAEGLGHIEAAERFFDNAGRAKDLLPAEVIAKLTKLAALHKSGALTDAEFAAEKKKILT